MILSKINRQYSFLALLMLTSFGTVLGFMLVKQPLIVWGLLAVLTFIIMLRLPVYYWALLAVVVSAFSRLVTYFEIAPGFINFIHFPIVIISAIFAALRCPGLESKIDRKIMVGSLLLGVLALFSWLANGGSLLQPVMSWLLFAEPLILVYALVRSIGQSTKPLLVKLAFFIVYIQVPLAIWQFYEYGYGDFVQGTMMGQGAGAHIVGAISLLGLVSIIGLVLGRFVTPLLLLLGVPLVIVPILADAKQAVIAFIISIFLVVFALKKIKLTRLLLASLIIVMILGAAFSFYVPLQMAFDYQLVSAGLYGKIISFRVIASAQLSTFHQLLLGLGPGNSVSRTALASQEGYVRSVSLGSFNLSSSAATKEIFFNTENDWLYSGSSVWGGISSFLGLFGDLGISGLAIYIWVLVVLWKALSESSSKYAIGSKGILLMAVILGLVYSWLEMPEFMITCVSYITLGLIPEIDESINYS